MTSEPQPGAPTALAAVLPELARLARLEAWQLSEDEVAAVFTGLDQARRLVEAAQVVLLAEAAGRGLPAKVGARTAGQWAERVVTGDCTGAHLLARRAGALYSSPAAADLGPTREAMLSGQVSGRQVDVLVDTVTKLSAPVCPPGTVDPDDLVKCQAVLLDAAGEGGITQMRRTADVLAALLDPHADERLRKDEGARDLVRGLTIAASSFTGMVHVEGNLTPQCGAALSAAIDSLSAPRPSSDGTSDLRSAAQRRHDGLQRLCEQAVAADGFLATTHGSPYRLTVTVGQETLAAALAAEPGQSAGLVPALLEPAGVALSPLTLRTLACNAEVQAVLVDGDGNPLDVADTHRLFSPRQRAAVIARDRHCSYPGCTAPPPWCDAHHVVWASRGGGTTVDNAALLCGYHHRHVPRTDQTAPLLQGRVVWQSRTPSSSEAADGVGVRPVTRADQAVRALVRRWRDRHA
jgi:hypothetical protein